MAVGISRRTLPCGIKFIVSTGLERALGREEAAFKIQDGPGHALLKLSHSHTFIVYVCCNPCLTLYVCKTQLCLWITTCHT
jgi:hypothetical protein